MSPQQAAAKSTTDKEHREHRLSLHEVLKLLLSDGLIDREAAEKLQSDRHSQRSDIHPLTVLASLKWKSLKPPLTKSSSKWLLKPKNSPLPNFG